MWFAVTATVLAGIAPLLLMRSTPLSDASSSAWVYAWVLSVGVGLRYAWLAAEGTRRLFEIVFWLFTYVFLGLAPLVQMRSGLYPGTTPDIDEDLNGPAMFVIAVGVVAFLVGSVAGGPHGPRPVRPVPPAVDPHRVLVLTRAALALAALYVAQIGLGPLLSSRAARTVAAGIAYPSPPIAALFNALATLPLVAAFTALVLLRRQRRAQGLRGPSVLPAVVLAALVLLNNPLSTARYVAGTALLSVLVVLGATATVRRMRQFSVALAVGLVLVFPYADVARYAGQSGSGKTGGPAQVLSSPDFDAFDQVNNGLAYVAAVDPPPGAQLVGAVLFFVPRNVWPGKPEDTGVVIANFRGYRVTNISAPLWAEAYVNGRIVGVLVALGLLGYVVRRWDERIEGQSPRPVSPGVLACTVPFYAIIMLRGSLLQSMAGFAVLLACGRYVAGSKRSREAAQPAVTPSSSSTAVESAARV